MGSRRGFWGGLGVAAQGKTDFAGSSPVKEPPKRSVLGRPPRPLLNPTRVPDFRPRDVPAFDTLTDELKNDARTGMMYSWLLADCYSYLPTSMGFKQ